MSERDTCSRQRGRRSGKPLQETHATHRSSCSKPSFSSRTVRARTRSAPINERSRSTRAARRRRTVWRGSTSPRVTSRRALHFSSEQSSSRPRRGAVHATLARVYRRLGDRETALHSAELARELLPEVPLNDPVVAAVGEESVSLVGLQKRTVDAESRPVQRRSRGARSPSAPRRPTSITTSPTTCRGSLVSRRRRRSIAKRSRDSPVM